jgi:glycerol kinase
MATAGWRSSSRVTSKPTALGAAILAGLGSGLFADAAEFFDAVEVARS